MTFDKHGLVLRWEKHEKWWSCKIIAYAGASRIRDWIWNLPHFLSISEASRFSSVVFFSLPVQMTSKFCFILTPKKLTLINDHLAKHLNFWVSANRLKHKNFEFWIFACTFALCESVNFRLRLVVHFHKFFSENELALMRFWLNEDYGFVRVTFLFWSRFLK